MLTIVLFIIYVCQVTPETSNKVQTAANSENDQVEVFTLDDVEYLFFGYQVTFDEACIICLSYKGQLAVLDTKEKAEFVIKAMSHILELGEFWVGAQSNKKNLWYWLDKNKKLKLDHTFLGGLRLWDPSELIANNDNCLTIYRKRHNIPAFVPLQCSKKRLFICERDIDKLGIEAKEVDVIKVDNEEYILYSAKATWTEAVVQCRQKDFQIAEVKSKKAAQAIATSMLRVRPDAMENAWIGGHFKNNVWEWVASKNDIIINELWANNSQISTGCLLLDRHVCEDPVYVSAKCDRKRHILCQKPVKKFMSKSPLPIQVEGCPYWIGIYPLDWIGAKKSCLTVNASLVILDSPTILNHMMNIMLNHKQELRHIWTDGYRGKKMFISGEETVLDVWHWTSTGSLIEESNFIPWCPVHFDSKNENCLNLDRENLKTPAVYGLDCGKNQTYVCQPWKGDCVTRRVQEDLLRNSEFLNLYSSLVDMKPVKTPAIALSQNSSREKNVSYLHEDISNMNKFHSTESYYTSSVSYSTPQQVNYLLDELTEPAIQETSVTFRDGKIFEDKGNPEKEREHVVLEPTEVNETNSLNLFTEFFSPLTSIQFTLPSLPQFGIRVVSAEETSPKSEVNHFSQRPQESSTILPVTENLAQIVKPKKKKISLPNSNKTLSLTNAMRNKNAPVLNRLSTTEEIENAPGGLYGENIDYDDTSPPSVTEIIENKKPNDNNEQLKSNESLSSGVKENLVYNLNISAILQKVIEEELELMKQQKEKSKPPLPERKSLINLHSGSAGKPQEELENKPIPPYYVLKTPLSVELSNDDTDVSVPSFIPELRPLDQADVPETMGEEPEARIDLTDTASDYFDFDSLKLDPYDKDSMLQLGRFLKNTFANHNSNPQTINFNLISRQDLLEEIMSTPSNLPLIEKNYVQRDTKAQKSFTTISPTPFDLHSTEKNLVSTLCQSMQPYSSLVKPEYLQQICGQAPVSVPPIQLFNTPEIFSEIIENSARRENENESKRDDGNEKESNDEGKSTSKNKNKSGNKNRGEKRGKNGDMYQRSVQNNTEKNAQKSLFNIFNNLVTGVRIDIKEAQLKTYVQKFVREKFPNPDKYDFVSKSLWHKTFRKILDVLNGTIIRFHGEKVQLRIGSFGYKMQIQSQERVNKLKIESSEQNGETSSYRKKVQLTSERRDEEPLTVSSKLNNKRARQRNTYEKENKMKDSKSEAPSKVRESSNTVNKVVKKSISVENEENPFPDFPIINFDINSAEDLNNNGYGSIRISRAIKTENIENLSSVVSVYIMLKKKDNTPNSNTSIPILELHVRMPASTNFAENVSGNNSKSRKTRLNNGQTVRKINGDFIKNIINNVTSFRTIPDLKRKRQLLSLALKYLKHISDEKQKKRSFVSESNSRYLNVKDGKEKKEILQVSQNVNPQDPQKQNNWQSIIYSGMEKRPLAFNMVENDLNSRTGVFSPISSFNFNTRRYDDILPRMRRNLQWLVSPRSRKLFADYLSTRIKRVSNSKNQ